MRNPFRREADGSLTWQAQAFEVGLLSSLAEQVIALVDAPDWSDDPLQRWANEQSASTLDRSDPVVARLFPEAYADPDQAREYRHLMEAEQRSSKAADARLVLDALAAADRERPVVAIAASDVQAWVKTTNTVRLALGARLGIETEVDAEEVDQVHEDDPRRPVVDVYHWLQLVQSALLDALTG